MTAPADAAGSASSHSQSEAPVQACNAVAVILQWRGKVGLFRRSPTDGPDGGLWHCITGYIERGAEPRSQALLELHEKTGLRAVDLARLRSGLTIELPGDGGGHCTVHTFIAETTNRRLQLNWEHDRYRWVPARATRRYTTVSWLEIALRAAEQFGPSHEHAERSSPLGGTGGSRTALGHPQTAGASLTTTLPVPLLDRRTSSEACPRV